MPTETGRFLASAARAAPSADNSQPFDFSWDGNEFAISFNAARTRGKLFGPASHATLLGLGACLENVDAALRALGLEGAWNVDDLAGGTPYTRLVVGDTGSRLMPTTDLALFGRHTNRFAFQKRSVPAAALQRVEGLAGGTARLRLLDGAAQTAAMRRHARSASEARFCTAEVHNYLMGSVRYTPAEIAGGEGVDVNTVPLPPGGKLFLRLIADWRRMKWLNGFGAFKLLAAADTALLADAPALLCIVAGRDAPGAIAAGRLLVGVWNELNAAGIAVHPNYGIVDQMCRLQAGQVPAAMVERVTALRDELPGLLATRPDESLQIVLRIGFPLRDPPRSRRLPLDVLYRDLR